jgi:hypothetical protein
LVFEVRFLFVCVVLLQLLPVLKFSFFIFSEGIPNSSAKICYPDFDCQVRGVGTGFIFKLFVQPLFFRCQARHKGIVRVYPQYFL